MEMEIEFDFSYSTGDDRNRRFQCTNFKKRDNEKERKEREAKMALREEQRKANSVTLIQTPIVEPAKPSKNIIISTRMTKEEKNKIYDEDMIVNKPKDKEHKMKCFRSCNKI